MLFSELPKIDYHIRYSWIRQVRMTRQSEDKIYIYFSSTCVTHIDISTTCTVITCISMCLYATLQTDPKLISLVFCTTNK